MCWLICFIFSLLYAISHLFFTLFFLFAVAVDEFSFHFFDLVYKSFALVQ
eukprot:m.243335 g.243335  ORF g.243335 m.243335 type:complete len:50 (+) comp27485_c0_seq1:25-174(+)